MKNKFEAISTEARKEIEEAFYKSIIEEFRKEMIEEFYYRYEVVVHDTVFQTYMTDDELKKSIELTLDLIEELKEINNNGIDRKTLDKIEESINDSNRVSRTMAVYHEFCSDKMHLIIAELDVVRRVGGAYAMLIANPVLISGIYAVYDRLVDNFDDENLYLQSAYFLLRAVMKMHSDELNI